mgnify:CR=1 FL=1|tara:strand:- start:418 stop:654 length:237 start_codon:yes stop_codon:yes gene_type:complete
MVAVQVNEIGSMLRQVTRDYGIPGHHYSALARAIQRNFSVLCTSQDIKDYEGLHVKENYELEGRRLSYGLQDRFREMF